MRAAVFGWTGVLTLLVTVPTPQGKEIQRLRWLTGCWEMREGNRRVVEQWTDNKGGLMLGTGRTFEGGRVTDYEFTAITPDSDGKLEYQAYPSRRKPASFALSVLSDTAVTFVNPNHDFPASITYARRRADSVIATIEGPSSGGAKQVVFPYRRIVCDNAHKDHR